MSEAFVCEYAGGCGGEDTGIYARFHRYRTLVKVDILGDDIPKVIMAGF